MIKIYEKIFEGMISLHVASYSLYISESESKILQISAIISVLSVVHGYVNDVYYLEFNKNSKFYNVRALDAYIYHSIELTSWVFCWGFFGSHTKPWGAWIFIFTNGSVFTFIALVLGMFKQKDFKDKFYLVLKLFFGIGISLQTVLIKQYTTNKKYRLFLFLHSLYRIISVVLCITYTTYIGEFSK